MHGQRFIAVTSPQPYGQHRKLMTDGDGGEARVKEPEPEAESYPIIVRSYEPVADLDDRLQRIYTRLSLPPVEEVEPRTPAPRARRGR
jgi:hypothetical protein